jgi:hypothetical protein
MDGEIEAKGSTRRAVVRRITVFAFLLQACGGSSAGPSRVVTTEPPEGPPIVTITASGVSPRELHIYAKDVATFVNNDRVAHDMRTDLSQNLDPACDVVGVGLLQPGESRKAELQPSGIPCYYRDNRDPNNLALKGYVLAHY